MELKQRSKSLQEMNNGGTISTGGTLVHKQGIYVCGGGGVELLLVRQNSDRFPNGI